MNMDCLRIVIIENKAFIPAVTPRDPLSSRCKCNTLYKRCCDGQTIFTTDGQLGIVQLMHSSRFQIKNHKTVLAARQYPITFQRISRQYE